MDDDERRGMRRAPLAWIVVVALVAGAACSGSSGDEGSLDTPTGVEVERAEGDRPAATVSFDAVAGAEAYLVEPSGEGVDPIRVEPEDCSASRCELTFDRMTVLGASSLTVRAVAGDGVSERSEVAELPGWPSPEDQADSEPVVLLVTREGAGGQPRVETETVEAGDGVAERVEARIAELEATDGVVRVDVQGPASALVPAQQPGGGGPEGLPSWPEWAWRFDSLPGPRGAGVTVAVIDEGIDLGHPALDGADIETINVRDPAQGLAADDHGTAVTSLIVGQPGGRVAGIAPGAKVRVYGGIYGDYDPAVDDPGAIRHPSASRMAEAIRRAVDDGAQVIVTSLTIRCVRLLVVSICPDQEIDPAIQHAEDNGVVVVAAAGNDADDERCAEWSAGSPFDWGDRTNADHWPAKLDTVVAVGAVRQDGSREVCSPDKDYIDVLAPGHRVRVAAGRDKYPVWSGTSFSAPLVGGLVAALLAERPDLSPGQVRDLLRDAIVDDEGRRDPAERGRLIPLYALRDLGLLDGLVVGERDLFAPRVVSDQVWPRLEDQAVATLDANPEDGTATQALAEVLGEPAVTEPASWRGTGGGDEGPPEPRQGSGIPPPECWSGLYGLMLWGEGLSPTFGVLYAREELPLESGERVPAGAIIGYRAYRASDLVRMADGVEIGQTQADLEEAYVDVDGRPYRAVELVGDGDEFELVDVGAARGGGGGGGRETSGALGPDLGRLSGHTDPETDTIVERGAGSDCGLEDGRELFAAICDAAAPGEGCGGTGPRGPDGPGDGSEGDAGHELEITMEGSDELYLTVWGPTNPSVAESGASCDRQPNSFRFYWEPGHASGSRAYDLEVFNWHCFQTSGDPGSVLSFTINVTVDGRALEPITGSVAPLEWWTHELEID